MVKKKQPTVARTFRVSCESAKRLASISDQTGMPQAKLVETLIERYGDQLEKELLRALKGK